MKRAPIPHPPSEPRFQIEERNPHQSVMNTEKINGTHVPNTKRTTWICEVSMLTALAISLLTCVMKFGLPVPATAHSQHREIYASDCGGEDNGSEAIIQIATHSVRMNENSEL
jgi:hypothetical protein